MFRQLRGCLTRLLSATASLPDLPLPTSPWRLPHPFVAVFVLGPAAAFLCDMQVVKNQAAYYHQARVEIGVLQYLNTRADPGDQHHIVRLKVI